MRKAILFLFGIIFSLTLVSCPGLFGNGSTNTNGNIVPKEKTLSDYKGGIRYLDLKKNVSDDIMFVSTVQPRLREDFSSIDNAMKTLDFDSSSTTIEQAANQIVSDCTSEIEKVRAIFDWVTLHVDYDNTYSRSEAEEAFTDRLAICDGYTKLVKAMCDAVGINCSRITGVAVRDASERECVLIPGGGDNYHAWNRIVLRDGRMLLLDATWGATGTVSNDDKELNDKWFDTDPCYFMFSHFIWGGDSDMLVSPSIDANEFVKLPYLDPSLEKFGIDGKELVEFIYSHPNASLPNCVINDGEGNPNVFIMPMSDTLLYGKNYQFVYECSGELLSRIISPSQLDDDYTRIFTNDSSISYKFGSAYTSRESSGEEEHKEAPVYLDPEFIVYDDNAEIDWSLYNTEMDGWRLSRVSSNGTYFYFYEKGEGIDWPSAIFDTGYQIWILVSGKHYSENYNGSEYENTKDFDLDLKTTARKLFTEIDDTIPLDRLGTDYYLSDYNIVYVPLSKKTEIIDSVKNYNWETDTDFADFVNWMKVQHVSQEDIDFYINMARYPGQRGRSISKSKFSEKVIYTRDAGIDSPSVCTQIWDDPECFRVGGMQYFFELKKRETRNLFKNKKIPILLVHIKNTEETISDIVPVDYENEILNIKNELETSGLKNEFEMYTVTISMPYSDFADKYITVGRTAYGSSYARWDDGWDDIVAEVAKIDSALAKKFEDKNTSALIKYFDTRDMNEDCGSWCAYNRIALWALMEDLGYERETHIRLFGSLMETHSPKCFARNCIRDHAVCPLCLYSFGEVYGISD